MARAGEWLQNTVTKELARITVSPEETGGTRLEAELWLAPGGAVMGEHVHDLIHERFTVLDGELAVVLDGVHSVAGPGDVVDIPPGRVHDWRNAGDVTTHVAVTVEGPAPMAARFAEMIEVAWGLANTGSTDAKGKPTPLWLAAMATEYRDVSRMSAPPQAVQRVVLAPLAFLARLAGRDVRAAWLHGDGAPTRVPAPDLAPEAATV